MDVHVYFFGSLETRARYNLKLYKNTYLKMSKWEGKLTKLTKENHCFPIVNCLKKQLYNNVTNFQSRASV